MKLNRKRISIRNKLLVIMLLVVLAQGVLFFSALNFNGGFDYLKKSAGISFANTTMVRKNTLENLMTNKWSKLEEYRTKVQAITNARLEEAGTAVSSLEGNKSLNQEILLAVTEDIIDMLRYNSTTEAYVVLNGSNGVVIRNLDKGTNADSQGFLLEAGPSEISREYGIPLDSYWTSRLEIDQNSEDSNWYTKPVEAAGKRKDAPASDLGYWSSFYRWHDNDIQVMSYSVPLVQDGEVYGVIGITVSEDYLESLLTLQELDADNMGSFVLCRGTGGKEYEAVFSTGIVTREVQSKEDTIVFDHAPVNGEVCQIKGSDGDFGNVQSIDLYRRKSPFSSEEWALIGVLPDDALFQTSDQLKLKVMAAFAISVILGIAGAVIGSYGFTRPIKRMAREINTRNVSEKLEFARSDVRELDALGSAIIDLNANVRENASKVAKIIELVDLPLGVIEYRQGLDKVFCTQKVIAILLMDEEYYKNGYLDRKYFERYLMEEGLSGLLNISSEKDYRVSRSIQQRWVHFKSLADNDKTLITMVDITKDIYERQKIEYERDYDILTHLLNRRSFKRNIQEILENNQQKKLGAMIMWDLDNLKYVNDTYGHDYGDQYIQRAAVIFGGLTRDGAVVGRISGDEFLAFIPDCKNKEHLVGLVEEVKKKLNATKVIMPDGEAVAIRASGGIAWYPDDGSTYDELTRYSDFAMYDTKKSYKGVYKEFDRKAYEKDSFLFHGREQLNRLIDGELVKYVFQPIVSTKDGEIFGYEALMRPEVSGLSSPTDVMRLAIAQSRLPDIEKLTFTKALRCYSERKEAFGDCRIFINSIPNQILPEKLLTELFEVNGIDPYTVIVEMIESEQADIEVLEEKIKILKNLHTELAVDDFGAGYSSESTLLYMQPDYVKIDMNIVRDIDKDKDRQLLISSTIQYARPKGIRMIAEGVETREEMKTLIGLGVDYLQGYYLGRGSDEVKDIPESVKAEIKNFNKNK